MEFVLDILAFIVTIGVLVTVHEFGHFWVARKLGVKVLRFSVGFGRPLWRRTAKDGVEYVIAAIPLGGYVKMLDENENEGEVDESELSRAFNRQGKLTRAAIAAAGPLFNFVFAVVAFWLVFVVGDVGVRPVIGVVEPSSVAAEAGFSYGDELKKVGDESVASWEQALMALASAAVDGEDLPITVQRESGSKEQLNLSGDSMAALVKNEKDVLSQLGFRPISLPAEIGRIVEGREAAQAGLLAGDRIISVDGVLVETWADWVAMIRKRPGQSMLLGVERGKEKLSITLRVGEVEEGGRKIGQVGVYVYEPDGYWDRMRVEVRYDPMTAFGLALKQTGGLSVLTLKFIWKIATGNASVYNLSGPLAIAQIAGKTASYGFVQFVKFLALVSVSLAVLNILPVPILDGGHLLFILVEAVRGKPLSELALEQAQRVGLAILLTLILLAFYVDINRLLN